jgi:hypothetical protein
VRRETIPSLKARSWIGSKYQELKLKAYSRSRAWFVTPFSCEGTTGPAGRSEHFLENPSECTLLWTQHSVPPLELSQGFFQALLTEFRFPQGNPHGLELKWHDQNWHNREFSG